MFPFWHFFCFLFSFSERRLGHRICICLLPCFFPSPVLWTGRCHGGSTHLCIVLMRNPHCSYMARTEPETTLT
ncbi:hypothetical protein GE09DRAFT_590992 [Coniochaeta sp. 2T2.1]|nr:hypothetical protein GE09DRAFT_590992 [Coniochaeta sp. 2T2.1]